MRVHLAIGLGFILTLCSLLAILSKSEERLAGTNAQVKVSGNDVLIRGRRVACQSENVPARAAALRVFVGGDGGPLEVSIREGNRTVARGRFGFVLDRLPATAELSPAVNRDIVPAEVCFRNRGRRTLRLAGDRTPLKFSGANPWGVVFADEPRIDYLRAGDESGWALAGIVADRFGRSKTSFFGSWTMWAVFALVGATWVTASWLLLRRPPLR
jgi:hypothetical protein